MDAQMNARNGRVAALVVAAAIGATSLTGGAAAQSTTASADVVQTPDPAIAVGLEVFNSATALGRIHDVVDRNGQRYAIITAGTTMGQPDRLIAVPYEKLKVVNGKLMLNESWASFSGRPTFGYQTTMGYTPQTATR